jgi:hypothetical protein
MTVIDAQVHIWGVEAPERPWPPGGAALAHCPTPLWKDELLRNSISSPTSIKPGL